MAPSCLVRHTIAMAAYVNKAVTSYKLSGIATDKRLLPFEHRYPIAAPGTKAAIAAQYVEGRFSECIFCRGFENM